MDEAFPAELSAIPHTDKIAGSDDREMFGTL